MEALRFFFMSADCRYVGRQMQKYILKVYLGSSSEELTSIFQIALLGPKCSSAWARSQAKGGQSAKKA